MTKLPRYNYQNRKIKHNYSNTILAKSISSKLSFENNTFFNVNFRGVRLRSSKFSSCNFILCDFYGAILNKGKFENTVFKKCVFYASILRECKFLNCKFEKCIFINTPKDFEKNSITKDCHKYNYYDLCIPEMSQTDFNIYREAKVFQKNRLLHIKGGKINKATIFIALNFFTYDGFKKRLELAYEDNDIEKIFTTFKLIEVLQKVM